jgi:SAM-dependent methyltransferase
VTDITKQNPYYVNKGTDLTSPSRSFNNYVKSILLYWAKHKISKNPDNDYSIFDLSCGRGGDLMKWYNIGYKRVLGSDIDESGINEAYKRIKEKGKTDKDFYEWSKKCELFVADTSKYLKDNTKLTNYVLKQLDKKFDVGISFFTAHYYFENEDKIKGFFKNLKKTIKKKGFVIVTCFDGDSVFNLLKNVEYNKTVSGKVENETVWEIKKKYTDSELTKKSGVAIDIKFESISNDFITEYLVQSDYFLDIAKEYGLSLVDNAKEIGLDGTGTFKDILDVVKNNLDKLETNKIGKTYYKDIKKFIEDPKYKELQVWNNLNRYYILQLS